MGGEYEPFGISGQLKQLMTYSHRHTTGLTATIIKTDRGAKQYTCRRNDTGLEFKITFAMFVHDWPEQIKHKSK